MSFNNAFILKTLPDETPTSPKHAAPRRRVTSDPVLPERLPSTSFLNREADDSGARAMLTQLRRSPPPESPRANSERRRTSSTSSGSSLSVAVSPKKRLSLFNSSPRGHWKDPQPFEIYKAVEKKDIMFLMEVRDRAFPLLLRKTGDATPLLHAMRIGESHREVAIILLGAFSRYINNLSDEEVVLPRTKPLLKALRTNLKLAIDYGLMQSQSDLTASFLQTLIMSEGEVWVHARVSDVSLALRSGTEGKPVHAAESAVRKFCTKELGKAALIATLEDYVANATVDLLMLSAWSLALNSLTGEQIPSWYFARDDRCYKAFEERLYKHKSEIQRLLSRRLKWQLRVLHKVMESRSNTYRNKVELLTHELDTGDGV